MAADSITACAQLFTESQRAFCDYGASILQIAKAKGHSTTMTALSMEFAKEYLRGQEPHANLTAFLERSYSHWDLIAKGTPAEVMEKADLVFGGLPAANLAAFVDIVGGKTATGEAYLTDAQRQQVKEHIVNLIRITVRYIHLRRCARPVEVDGKTVTRYTVDFHPEVKVREEVQRWQVTL